MPEKEITNSGQDLALQGASAVAFADRYLGLPHEKREGLPNLLDPNSITHEVETFFLSPEVAFYPKVEKKLISDLLEEYNVHILKEGISVENFPQYIEDWKSRKAELAGGFESALAEVIPKVVNDITLSKVKDFASNEALKAEWQTHQVNDDQELAKGNAAKWRKIRMIANAALTAQEIKKSEKKRIPGFRPGNLGDWSSKPR